MYYSNGIKYRYQRANSSYISIAHRNTILLTKYSLQVTLANIVPPMMKEITNANMDNEDNEFVGFVHTILSPLLARRIFHKRA